MSGLLNICGAQIPHQLRLHGRSSGHAGSNRVVAVPLPVPRDSTEEMGGGLRTQCPRRIDTPHHEDQVGDILQECRVPGILVGQVDGLLVHADINPPTQGEFQSRRRGNNVSIQLLSGLHSNPVRRERLDTHRLDVGPPVSQALKEVTVEREADALTPRFIGWREVRIDRNVLGQLLRHCFLQGLAGSLRGRSSRNCIRRRRPT